MLFHFNKLSIKQGLKTQYFLILKEYTERITIGHGFIGYPKGRNVGFLTHWDCIYFTKFS